MADTPLYGLMAEFTSTDALVSAAERVHQEGYTRIDALTPMPVHGLAEAMGYDDRRIQKFILCGGLAGTLFGLGLQLHVNLIGTLAGMIIPVGAWAFSILVMTEFMKEIPVELEEAARLDGAGDLRIFWSVVLPLCRPALGVVGIFGFTMIWDQYMLPLLVADDAAKFTLPLALRTLRSDDQVGLGVLLAAALLALLPSVLAFLAMQRQFMRGLTSGAIKG